MYVEVAFPSLFDYGPKWLSDTIVVNIAASFSLLSMSSTTTLLELCPFAFRKTHTRHS